MMTRSAKTAAFLAGTVVTAGLLTATPASALGNETFGCQTSPGPAGPYLGNCHNSAKYGPGPFSAGFLVQGAAAGTTYTWTVPAGYQVLAGTCTSTSSGCRVDNLVGDTGVVVSVKLSQGGQSRTLSATAVIAQVCGDVFC
jgi:hypothetical protein